MYSLTGQYAITERKCTKNFSETNKFHQTQEGSNLKNRLVRQLCWNAIAEHGIMNNVRGFHRAKTSIFSWTRKTLGQEGSRVKIPP